MPPENSVLRDAYLPASLDAALQLEGGAVSLTTTEPLLSVRNMGAGTTSRLSWLCCDSKRHIL